DTARGTQPAVDYNLSLAQRLPQRSAIQQVPRAEFDRHARDSRRAMHSVHQCANFDLRRPGLHHPFADAPADESSSASHEDGLAAPVHVRAPLFAVTVGIPPAVPVVVPDSLPDWAPLSAHGSAIRRLWA